MWDIWETDKNWKLTQNVLLLKTSKSFLSQFPLHSNFSQGIYTNASHLAPLGLSPGYGWEVGRAGFSGLNARLSYCLPLFPGIADRLRIGLLRPLKLSAATYPPTP